VILAEFKENGYKTSTWLDILYAITFFCTSLYKMCAQFLYESMRGIWMQRSYLF